MSEAPYALFLIFLVLLGLYLSNLAYDSGIKHHLSRKIAHIFGGMAYLVAPYLFSSWAWPVALSGGMVLLLAGARILRPTTFRGTGGSGRKNAIAEINFPLAGTISLLVLWAWLGEPKLAVIPPMLLGFGDSITGIVRSRLYEKETKAWQGSAAMLGTCLLVAYMASPYWIGALAAVAATIAEKLTPGRWWIDDNITLVLAAVGVIVLGLKVGG